MTNDKEVIGEVAPHTLFGLKIMLNKYMPENTIVMDEKTYEHLKLILEKR